MKLQLYYSYMQFWLYLTIVTIHATMTLNMQLRLYLATMTLLHAFVSLYLAILRKQSWKCSLYQANLIFFKSELCETYAIPVFFFFFINGLPKIRDSYITHILFFNSLFFFLEKLIKVSLIFNFNFVFYSQMCSMALYGPRKVCQILIICYILHNRALKSSLQDGELRGANFVQC